MATPPRPIGYWLKRLDRAIEDGFARDLAAFGIARRHWQVLNTLSAGPTDPAVVSEALAPFWTDGAVTEEEVMHDLAERGWAVRSPAQLTLTDAGRESHRLVAARIAESRARMLDGLTPDDYDTAVRVLERMTRNQEPPADEADGPAR